ncbi:MAG: hypothetical protein COY68_04610 [Candidatus Levybacteria bacterium CG_4_10_14_0_8_um_filter_35_23]|nr:MAG: hypothetical protein COY68_04610 [Candidatus Levybacteria bacterium CG_4_10_14_0_8_um_filter_35_23]
MKSLPNLVRKEKGFTLIELLVVIGILAILLSIVLIAINPARQFGQANDTRRRSEVTQILNAVGAYAADHKGVLPAAISGLADDTATQISNTGADICADLVPNYIPALPQDPQQGTGTAITACGVAYDTGYQIAHDAAGRVTVSAPQYEGDTAISNTR